MTDSAPVPTPAPQKTSFFGKVWNFLKSPTVTHTVLFVAGVLASQNNTVGNIAKVVVSLFGGSAQ